jgi:hypothetical protein
MTDDGWGWRDQPQPRKSDGLWLMTNGVRVSAYKHAEASAGQESHPDWREYRSRATPFPGAEHLYQTWFDVTTRHARSMASRIHASCIGAPATRLQPKDVLGLLPRGPRCGRACEQPARG